MKAIIISLTIVLLLLFCGTSTFAVKRATNYRNAKMLGMGGVRVTNGFGYNGFVDNPALLTRVKPFRLSIINLPITMNKNFWEITGFIAENSDKFQTYDDLTEDDKFEFLNDLEEHDAKWSRMRVTPMVDIAGSFFRKTELNTITDSNGKSYEDDKAVIQKAIDDNEVVFTVYKNDSISFGKDKENPGKYFISKADAESRKEFDTFEDAYKYWTKKYRNQYDKGFSMGLALYNNSTIALKVDRGVYEPRVWGQGFSDVAAIVGFAVPIPMLVPGLTVGANIKYLQRRTADVFQIKASALGEEALETIEPVLDEAEENKSSTAAVDIGMLWDIGRIDSEVGASFQSLGDGRNASLDIGIAKHFFNDNLSVYFDIIDFFDNTKEHYFRKVHIGTQLKMDYFYLRTGFNSGYPSAGVGLNWGLFDIDLAYFTRELSNTPGLEEDTRFSLQLKLGY